MGEVILARYHASSRNERNERNERKVRSASSEGNCFAVVKLTTDKDATFMQRLYAEMFKSASSSKKELTKNIVCPTLDGPLWFAQC